MLDFHTPTLEDKDWVNKCLIHANSMNCDYSFGNLFIWKNEYKTEICKYKDFLICRWLEEDDKFNYSLPLGEGDFTQAVNVIIEDAKENNCSLKIYGVTLGYLSMLREAFTGKFDYICDDAYNDYIYSTEKMATLRGKKYHSKRNHITNFKKNNPDWKFEIIDKDNISDCIDFHKKWLIEKNADDEDLSGELNAVTVAFDNYSALDMIGGLIRVGGEVVAYTMGEALVNGKCFVTHFEKARADIQGAYAIINQEFTLNCISNFQFVNREEDLGIEGLRKAKRSYIPEIFLEKSVAVFND